MKRVIAGVVIGLILGMSATALAAASAWRANGETYTCTGNSIAVICKETNWRVPYKIAFLPSMVNVSFGSKVIYSCARKQQPSYDSCISRYHR